MTSQFSAQALLVSRRLKSKDLSTLNPFSTENMDDWPKTIDYVKLCCDWTESERRRLSLRTRLGGRRCSVASLRLASVKRINERTDTSGKQQHTQCHKSTCWNLRPPCWRRSCRDKQKHTFPTLVFKIK